MSSLSQHPTIISFRNFILKILDFFYPPFRRFLPKQTFRYLACGGSVTLLGLSVYALSYNFLFKQADYIQILHFHITGYIAAYAVSFCFSFPTGFFLSKFVVFSGSYLKGRVQLFRYGSLQGLNIFFNWALLHLFAGYLGFWPTFSQALTGIIIAVVSYFFQRYISFRGGKLLEIHQDEK